MADRLCDPLTVKQCLESEKLFQTAHTNQIIIAGLHGDKVRDPWRDIKVKDGEITISEAEKQFSIIHLTSFMKQHVNMHA